MVVELSIGDGEIAKLNLEQFSNPPPENAKLWAPLYPSLDIPSTWGPLQEVQLHSTVNSLQPLKSYETIVILLTERITGHLSP